MIYRICYPKEKSQAVITYGSVDDFPRFEGKRYSTAWSSPRCGLIDGELTDFMYFFAGVPICSEKVLAGFQEFLEREVEFLPLNIPELDLKYFLFNPVNVINCLNVGLSEVDYFRTSGRLKSIKKYVFDNNKLGNCNVFKIPETAFTELFCTDKFVQKYEDLGFGGLSFQRLN